MKFLHLADLHLGKRLNDVSLLDDQIVLLRQAEELALREKADAVLVAGDVYQKASPSSEAMAAFDGFVTRLASAGVRVFAISGNHDSAQRVSYFSSLLRRSGVYVSEEFDGRLQQVSLEDEYGEITIHLLPFVKPAAARRFYPQEKIETYQDAVEAVLRHSAVDPEKRNVLLCHQFVAGAEISESEELSVGGLEQIDARTFDAFDYVALGHIHKPQRCLRDTLRYAGSLMKYSFSEIDQQKSITVVEMKEKGNVQWRLEPLKPPRELRQAEGFLEEIMRMPYSEDYLWVTLHDELPPPDARVSVTTVFPNLMRFTVVNSKTREDQTIVARETLRNKTPLELFEDFYRLQNNDKPPAEGGMKLMQRILEELEDEEK